MEKSKQSEEEILKLGKKIIKELELVYTVNTLARWLGHYLAELMNNIDNCEFEEKKSELQKECCNVILELWEKRERIPIEKPTEKLKPILDILGLLKSNEHPFIHHRFLNNHNGLRNKDSSWHSFLEIVKKNSERIYRKSLISMISEELLEKDKEWIEEHGSFLSTDEKSVLEYLDSMKEISISIIDGSEKEITEKERIENLFTELEELIDDQKVELSRLKKKCLKF